uniref:Protein kinase domain-containing protein n=1 Tax=Arcella intermedia TaxID=1963864 RepID=A0A6B2L0R2_9EUKA
MEYASFPTVPNPSYIPVDVLQESYIEKGQLKIPLGNAQFDMSFIIPERTFSHFRGHAIDLSKLPLTPLSEEFSHLYKSTLDNQPVVIKTLNKQLCDSRSFRREILFLTTINHPSLLSVKGISLHPLAFASEYCVHGNLYDFYHSNKKMSWKLRLRITIDIAKGLHFLHGITPPIIHGDMKSPNILIYSLDTKSSTSLIKIADMGNADFVTEPLTYSKVVNPLWLAPEILKHKRFTEQSDTYSFGVICWEIVTRKHYFQDEPFLSQISENVCKGIRPDIPHFIPDDYSSLISRCWDSNAEVRPSFNTILETLENLLPSVKEYSQHFKNYDALLFNDQPKNTKTIEEATQTYVSTSPYIDYLKSKGASEKAIGIFSEMLLSKECLFNYTLENSTSTFNGTDIVNWLIKNGKEKSEALEIGRELVLMGAILNCKGTNEFEEEVQYSLLPLEKTTLLTKSIEIPSIAQLEDSTVEETPRDRDKGTPIELTKKVSFSPNRISATTSIKRTGTPHKKSRMKSLSPRSPLINSMPTTQSLTTVPTLPLTESTSSFRKILKSTSTRQRINKF